MLTQHEIRTQLDALANEVLQPPGLYYELYSKLFSERVHHWIDTTQSGEAALIRRVAERDPDYASGLEILARNPASHFTRQPLPINPAWDMDY